MKFLTSMMLLGLTKAQLDVYRWKAFTIGSLTPLERILDIGDNVQDDLILNVRCDDNTNERDFWYNGITYGDVGSFICPAYYGEESGGQLTYSPDGMTCDDQISGYPTDNYITSDEWNGLDFSDIP